jgi:FtsZ-interacting cell division protein ZipA
MSNATLIAIIVVIAVIAIIAAVVIARRRRSQHLRSHFGPEYDRTLQMQGNPAKAEAVLLEREERVKKFSLRPLPPVDRERYAGEWAAVQRRFVDDPSMAVTQADRLVTTVMAARGYPMTDAEQREADLSVTYPGLVQNYRSARELTQRHQAGQSSTEDLRQAMVYFRSLFDELLEVPKPQRVGEPRAGDSHERLAS